MSMKRICIRVTSGVMSFLMVIMLLSAFTINGPILTPGAAYAAPAEESGDGIVSGGSSIVGGGGNVNGGGGASLVPAANGSGEQQFPKLAVLFYTNGGPRNAAQEEACAKFDLVVTNFWLGWFPANGPDAMQNCVQNMKSYNPDLLVGNYTNPMEINSDYNNTATVPLYDKVESGIGPNGVGNWWAINAAGNHVSSYPGTWLVNLTRFATQDANGWRYPQWVANWYNENFYQKVPEFDFWFMDNILYMPRVEADWNGDGADDNRNNADTRRWYREGLIDYVDAIKALDPNAIVIGNSDGLPEDRTTGFLNDVEFKGKLEGALFEGAIGKSYSIESWNNWENTMKAYRDLMANTTEPHLVMFDASFPAGSNYSLARYEMGTCLLDDGYIAIEGGSYDADMPLWFDEFDLAGTASTKWLGAPIDPPQAAPWQNGVYRRDFENGMVLVNPKGNGAQTVTVPAGYSRILGTQDPVANNGEPATSVTLQARDGLILVKDKVEEEKPMEFPRLANISYGGATGNAAANAKYDLVILNFYLGWGGGSTAMRKVVTDIKAINPDCLVGTYTNPMESNSNSGNAATAEIWNKMSSEIGPNGVDDWWARDAAGNPVSEYSGTWMTNVTRLVTPDADGNRVSQWMAQWYHKNIIQPIPELDFWFFDNIMYKPRADADFDRDGTMDSQNNLTVRQWYREGLADFVDEIRVLQPDTMIIGNPDGDPNQASTGFLKDPEYSGLIEGALIEGAIGKSYSIETWNYWEGTMKSYRDLLTHTKAPHLVLFGASFPSGSNYSLARYEIGSCLLDNGYIAIDNGSYDTTPWFDEYDLAGTASTKWLGAAIDPPQTEPWQNGIYRRDFENGMVLVNPKNTGNVARTVTIPAGYKRFQGVQDPVANNGEKVTTITLEARDAIILVKDNSVDKTQLLDAIALALSLEEPDFTTGGWADLQTELAAAQIVADDDKATQDAINDAYTALQAALDERMALLNLAIDEAESLRIGDYTAASWLGFLPALAAAKSVATNVSSPQADVNAARDGLLAAMGALVEPAKYAGINIDGDTSDWDDIDPLAEGGQEVTSIKVTNDNSYLYFCIEGPNMIKDLSSTSPYLELMLDTDCDGGTGYYMSAWPGSGIDYLVEASENNLYGHTGVGNGFTWNNQGDNYTVTYASDTVIEVKIAKAALGITDGDINVSVSLYDADWDRAANGYLPVSGQPMMLYQQKIVPEKLAWVSISGPGEVVSGAGAAASYVISGASMPDVGAIDFEIEVDGNYLSSLAFNPLNGFAFFSAGNYGTPLWWRNEGDKWIGKAILLNQAGIAGDHDILELVFSVAEGKLGATEVKLNYAVLSYAGDTIDSEIANGAAVTVFTQYYSPYDLNKDGVIDLNDLTFALQYLTAEDGDANWDEAKIADVDGTGVVDIDDLILILANYTISYYG